MKNPRNEWGTYMKKYHDMQSVFSIAFLYFSVSGIISFAERLVLIPLNWPFNSYHIVSLSYFVILAAVIVFLVKKTGISTVSQIRDLFNDDSIRVTSGFLILISSAIGILNWIPSALHLIYIYFKSMPASDNTYSSVIYEDIIEQYTLNFQKNFISQAVFLLFIILNFFAGIYMVYLYGKKTARSIEPGETADGQQEG